jgi:hypothetical protein
MRTKEDPQLKGGRRLATYIRVGLGAWPPAFSGGAFAAVLPLYMASSFLRSHPLPLLSLEACVFDR